MSDKFKSANSKLSLLLFALAILSAARAADEVPSINDFKRSYFGAVTKNSNFYQVAAKLGTAAGERPLFYGYLNKDLYTDVLTLSKSRNQVFAYFYNDDEGEFEKKIDGPVLADQVILAAHSTIATSSDALPDLVLVTQTVSSKAINLRVYKVAQDGNNFSLQEQPALVATSQTGSGAAREPVSFQLFQDTAIKQYWILDSKQGGSGDLKRMVYSFDRETGAVNAQDFSEFVDSGYDSVKGRTIVTPGASAFLDLDRDCRPDLVLETANPSDGSRALEVYVYSNSGKFTLAKTIQIPANLSAGTFVDLNEDNAYDLAFFDKSSGQLVSFLGKLEGADRLDASATCLQTGLAYSLPALEAGNTNAPWARSQVLAAGSTLSEDVSNGVYATLRFGDIDLDGFTDLVVNLSAGGKNGVHFFRNVACSDEQVSADTSVVCRAFDGAAMAARTTGPANKDTLQSSLFDFGERGLVKKQTGNCVHGNR